MIELPDRIDNARAYAAQQEGPGAAEERQAPTLPETVAAALEVLEAGRAEILEVLEDPARGAATIEPGQLLA